VSGEVGGFNRLEGEEQCKSKFRHKGEVHNLSVVTLLQSFCF